MFLSQLRGGGLRPKAPPPPMDPPLHIHESVSFILPRGLLRGRPSFSSFTRAYRPYAGGGGVGPDVRFFQIIENDDRSRLPNANRRAA